MNIEDVGKIIDKIDKSSISFFELDIENCHLKLDKSDTRRYEGTETSRIVENAPKEPSYILEKNNFSETALTSEKLEKTEDAEDDENITFVKSPIVGTFYDAPSPDSESYVKVGTKVKEGDILCIIESMKLMNEIEAEESGEVVEILVKNGEMVQYGDPIFKIRRN